MEIFIYNVLSKSKLYCECWFFVASANIAEYWWLLWGVSGKITRFSVSNWWISYLVRRENAPIILLKRLVKLKLLSSLLLNMYVSDVSACFENKSSIQNILIHVTVEGILTFILWSTMKLLDIWNISKNPKELFRAPKNYKVLKC